MSAPFQNIPCYYCECGLKQGQWLPDFYLKMEFGEHPQKIIPQVDRMVKGLERLERLVDPDDVVVVIPSELRSQ